MKKPLPLVALALALATLLTSLTVATVVNGSPWSRVPILKLQDYGGVTNNQLANGEWWRLLTAQLVHVSPAHMVFNVITLFLLAVAIERAAGPVKLFSVWLVGGIAGVYASIYSIPPPYDIGSGASQAVMGLAAAAIVVGRRHQSSMWLWVTISITLVVGIGLDLYFASEVKPGHVVPFFVGLIFALITVPVASKPKAADAV
jgi:membrane associated rhomboid family serine protease